MYYFKSCKILFFGFFFVGLPAFGSQPSILSVSCEVGELKPINANAEELLDLNYAEKVEFQIKHISSESRTDDKREFYVEDLRLERKNTELEQVAPNNYFADYRESFYDDNSIMLRYQDQKRIIAVNIGYDEDKKIIIQEAWLQDNIAYGEKKGSWYLFYKDAQESKNIILEHEMKCSIDKSKSKNFEKAALGPNYVYYYVEEALMNRIKEEQPNNNDVYDYASLHESVDDKSFIVRMDGGLSFHLYEQIDRSLRRSYQDRDDIFYKTNSNNSMRIYNTGAFSHLFISLDRTTGKSSTLTDETVTNNTTPIYLGMQFEYLKEYNSVKIEMSGAGAKNLYEGLDLKATNGHSGPVKTNENKSLYCGKGNQYICILLLDLLTGDF